MRKSEKFALSERRFYQKITDIYATSVDYNRDAPTTKAFFSKVQNKLHFAIHGYTAAELILHRADSTKENMGLTSWEKAPDGKILKADVTVAKNYLTKEELESLGRTVNAYLDLAEERALRKIPMTMEDWAKRLNRRKMENRAKNSAVDLRGLVGRWIQGLPWGSEYSCHKSIIDLCQEPSQSVSQRFMLPSL